MDASLNSFLWLALLFFRFALQLMCFKSKRPLKILWGGGVYEEDSGPIEGKGIYSSYLDLRRFIYGVGAGCGLGVAKSFFQGDMYSLHGVWGSSGTNVFAVGTNGTILHYNGSTWLAMSSGSTDTLRSVWGSSGTNVFAVGTNGTILHYNGSTWSAMSSGTTNSLHSVWGSSGTDIFAVGWAGTILHYNGSAWSAMSSGTTYYSLFRLGKFGDRCLCHGNSRWDFPL